jgi:3-hydroxyisobutyrate dehydrogenase
VSNIVGLIGAGALGSALLERLIAAGLTTQTYDAYPPAAEAARALNATIVDSPRATAYGADRVHICVRTDEEMLDAALGPAGVLDSMRAGATLVLHSTIRPETTRRIGAAAMRYDVDVLDAPVVGVPSVIRAGKACFLVGGRAPVVDAVRPDFLRLVRAVYYFGALGAGNVAKIAKNLATAADRIVLIEAIELAEAGGLDAELVLDMMRAEFHPAVDQWERAFDVDAGHAKPRPTTNLFDKDIQLAAAFAAERDLVLPVTRGVAETAARWVAAWNRNSEAAV